MKIRAVTAGILLAAALVACIELFAGTIILKNSHEISGRIIRDDDDLVMLGYRHGTLTLSKKYVERVIEIGDLSEYAAHMLPPTDEELSALESLFLKTPEHAGRPRPKPPTEGKQAALTEEFRTVRHVLKGGAWDFSFELPANWIKEEKAGILTFIAPGDNSGTAVCAAILDTPPVTLAKQALLTEASAKAELSGLTAIYSVTRQAPRETGECTLLGIYGPPGRQTIVKTILRRTPSHTFILMFFVPVRLHEGYRPLFSICRESVRLKETNR